jgi:vacuolar-type H+-ATPase subunit C/Vma6
MNKIKEERREVEELRLIYKKKIEQMERDQAEEEMERAAQ